MFPSPLVRCLDRLLAATRFQPKGASLCCGGVAATPARSTRLHFIVCDLVRVVKGVRRQNREDKIAKTATRPSDGFPGFYKEQLYAVKGLLLGLTMSRPLSPPAVLPHAPSLPARRSGRPCPPNTAQRCHSEPVRRLAWESVPRASLCERGVTAFGRDGGREKTETGGVPQGHSFRFAPQRRAPPLRSVESPQRPTGEKAPLPTAARYFSSRRGAALKAYFVYVKAPPRPTGEKAPPPSAARYFASRRGAALKAYFVYVEVLQRCIGGKEPPPTRPRRRTPAYMPPPPRSAPARTHP